MYAEITTIIIENKILNILSDIECAIFAPIDAVKTLLNYMPINAGR